ncbi:hypothetical protein BO82DRAFT_397333 [Aspergillus uvarum CBS 121591]|uniref:Uncharacterized protein n=1 Tax=Aspergillus uvarum CBS 121591 TaxID=1448315 RepID=A0A319CQR9_9EURO|nr:hypothetical protein BO82DRAFT_397333 [Aspergillus uvarum CBS 121591]PYH86759.1 hypothetical protein BO82DRAFT_397333 [Aspergillus uvarum CBS 121591]
MANLLGRIIQSLDDIIEGNLFLPDIHRIHCDPTILELLNIIKHRGEETMLKAHAVDYPTSTAGFTYVH